MNLHHRSNLLRIKPARIPCKASPQPMEALESRTLMAATPVAAPTGVTVTTVSQSALHVAWVDQSTNETHFVLDRALATGRFRTIASLPADATHFEDAGLAPNTRYRYRVRAAAAEGVSKWALSSGTTSGWTVQTEAEPTQVDLSWTDYWTGETAYVVERNTGKGRFKRVATLPADSTSFSDTTVSRDTTYTYQVSAVTGGKKSKPGRGNATTPTEPPVPAALPPAAPAALSAASPYWSRADLVWADNSGDELGFKLEHSRDGVAWSEVAVVGANVTSFAATGLTASTTYQFRVRAYNAVGDSAYSNIADTTTPAPPPAAPAAPSSLAAAASSSSRIDLTWADNSGDETGFKVERSSNNGATWAEIATVSADTTSYAATGLTAATAYQFRVRATNSAGDSAYSNIAGAATLAVPPAAPTSLGAVAVSAAQINLTWTDASNNESSFKIERSTDGSNYVQVGTAGANATTYSAGGLSPATTYYFRVRASNGAGDSAYSGAASAVTAAVPPAAPSSLSAVAASAVQINLTWADNSGNESGFKIERSADGVNYVQIATAAANATSYSATGLSASTTYQFRVRAFNAAGDSPYSTGASATTPALPPPSPQPFAVTRLVLVNADTDRDVMDLAPGASIDLNTLGTANLNVRAETSAGAESVRFVLDGAEVRTESSAPYTLGGDAATGGAGGGINYLAWNPSVGQHTLVGTPYAQDAAAGGAGEAMTVTFTISDSTPVPTAPPAAPAGLSATAASSSRIDLSWSGASSDEAGFKIERSTDGTAWTQIGTVAAGVTTYAVNDLAAETTYHFRVRAHNSVGDSGYSNSTSATTAAAPQAGARPGATNTGPTNPTDLRASDSIVVTQNGAVIENVDVTGTIEIRASNVTLRNFRIRATGAYGIRATYGGSGILIEDGEITGMSSAGVYGSGFTARRLNVHHSGSDAMKPGSNAVIESCWFHHLGSVADSHADGVQMVAGTNVTIRGNFFDMRHDEPGFNNTQCIIIQSDIGRVDNITIQDNWINGGGYSVQIRDKGTGYGVPTNVRITGNRFGRQYQFGTHYVDRGAGLVWSNNVWDDTGATIAL